MPEIPDSVKRNSEIELARRSFWYFEQAMYPEIFRDERWLLKDVAERMQSFIEDSSKHFLVISLPPAHYKSFQARNLVLWLLGRDYRTRIISASNAHDLAETFSSQIRDTILGVAVGKNGIPYPEIFPDTQVKQGYATKAKWQLAGVSQPTYLATSPTSTLTGNRGDVFVLDDVVRNALDAMNESNLEAYWTWFRDTLFTRTDGDNYKFISVMQRWAKRDLSGHIIEFFGDDVEVIDYKIETDGKILDETIVSREKLNTIKKTLSPEIYSANYMQEPIDIKGRLFDDLEEYDSIPQSNEPVKAYVDTADTGTDYFCGMAYKYIDGKVYILPEIVFTQDSAEATEPMTAKMLTNQEVSVATFESNNGGRMFARNIERIMQENGNRKTVVEWKPTTSNKEARILSNSAWVQHNIYMPKGWKSLYPEMAAQILSYVKGGKNKHDDAIDVLVAIAESCNSEQVEYLDASDLF